MKFKLLAAYLWPFSCLGLSLFFLQVGIWFMDAHPEARYAAPAWWVSILFLLILWSGAISVGKTFRWSMETIRANRQTSRQRLHRAVRPPGT